MDNEIVGFILCFLMLFVPFMLLYKILGGK